MRNSSPNEYEKSYIHLKRLWHYRKKCDTQTIIKKIGKRLAIEIADAIAIVRDKYSLDTNIIQFGFNLVQGRGKKKGSG